MGWRSEWVPEVQMLAQHGDKILKQVVDSLSRGNILGGPQHISLTERACIRMASPTACTEWQLAGQNPQLRPARECATDGDSRSPSMLVRAPFVKSMSDCGVPAN